MPATHFAPAYFFEGFPLVQGAEARLLEAFVAECPALRSWPLVDAYRALLAARRVLARDLADQDGPGAGVPSGAGRPDPCGPSTPAPSAGP